MARLLSALLLTLSAHGLAPEALDPWRGWVAFKEFVRAVDESPDPGISVQFTPATPESEARLIFLRQEAEIEEGELTPRGGIICEFTFDGSGYDAPWERWSFDHATFERFVDVVELQPSFQDLLVTRPLSSAVYWQEI